MELLPNDGAELYHNSCDEGGECAKSPLRLSLSKAVRLRELMSSGARKVVYSTETTVSQLKSTPKVNSFQIFGALLAG